MGERPRVEFTAHGAYLEMYEYEIKTSSGRVRCVECNAHIANASHICKAAASSGQRWYRKDPERSRRIRLGNAKKILDTGAPKIFRVVTTREEYETSIDDPRVVVDRRGILRVKVGGREKSTLMDDEVLQSRLLSRVRPFLPSSGDHTPPHYWSLDF